MIALHTEHETITFFEGQRLAYRTRHRHLAL